MDDARIAMLLVTRGADFPPVVHAIAALPEDHPLKLQVQAVEAAAAQAVLEQELQVSPEDRLAALEARVTALEGTTP